MVAAVLECDLFQRWPHHAFHTTTSWSGGKARSPWNEQEVHPEGLKTGNVKQYIITLSIREDINWKVLLGSESKDHTNSQKRWHMAWCLQGGQCHNFGYQRGYIGYRHLLPALLPSGAVDRRQHPIQMGHMGPDTWTISNSVPWICHVPKMIES